MAGTLLKTLKFLKIAIDKLGLDFSLPEIEKYGIMVDKAMSTEARNFHTAEHIFALADVDRPKLLIAAIFHDIVYYTVDLGFIPEIEELLSDYILVDNEEHTIRIREDLANIPPSLNDLFFLFNFQPGDKLPNFGGMNEFLSALVFYLVFREKVDRKLAIAIFCCIELTIPFRGKNKEGLSPPEQLAQRLNQMNTEKKLDFSESEILILIQDAVSFANTDVLNFSSNEASIFLDNTWKLLPETNPALRTTGGIYTVKNYRIALQKIYSFMNYLDPQIIFLSYKGIPNEFDFHYLNFRATRNVKAAREYLGVKLLTIGILEAITEISGGDAPIALLMGDVGDQGSLEKFEELLPKINPKEAPEFVPTVYALLNEGRHGETAFDLNRSPLATFVYLFLGSKNLGQYISQLETMFKGELKPSNFLNQLPSELILPIISACSQMSFTRSKILLSYYNERKGK